MLHEVDVSNFLSEKKEILIRQIGSLKKEKKMENFKMKNIYEIKTSIGWSGEQNRHAIAENYLSVSS